MMSLGSHGELVEQAQDKVDPRIAKGLCLSILPIGDDHGDNACTMRCQLKTGHSNDELHREEYESGTNGKVIVQWAEFGEDDH